MSLLEVCPTAGEGPSLWIVAVQFHLALTPGPSLPKSSFLSNMMQWVVLKMDMVL